MTKKELKTLVSQHLVEPVASYKEMFDRAAPMGKVSGTSINKIVLSILEYIESDDKSKTIKK